MSSWTRSGTARGGYSERGARSGRRGDEGGRKRKQPIVIWAEDQASFKVEQENEGISDHTVQRWLQDLRTELGGWSSGKVCSTLNLSRNDLEDYGVQEIMKFFIKEQIPVQMIKLYKNWISDDGTRAIGDLIKQAPDPVVQEIHLSHNCISADGAMAIFQAVRESNRYPCSRGKEGSPLWLRMENNSIVWDPVIREINEWKDFSWITGDTRDAWRKDSGSGPSFCPILAMHRSYHHQNAASSQSVSGSRSRGSGWHEEDREVIRDGWDDQSVDELSHSTPPGDSGDAGRYQDGGCGGAGQWRRWDRAPARHEDDDDMAADGDGYVNGSEIQEMRRFVDEKLTAAAEMQMKKFNLIFSILGELQERQTKLENSMQDLVNQQVQHQQHHQTPVQAQQSFVLMNPVDGGGQQNWAGDQHQFGSGVW